MTSKCGYCVHWDGDKRDIDTIAFCEPNKIFIRGTRNGCDDFEVDKS